MYPKFIITREGCLRLGMVNLHKHLLLPGDVCLGGGYWRVDYQGMRLLLNGESYDYGPPRWDQLGNTLLVPDGYAGMPIAWITKSGHELSLNARFTIKYY